MNTLIHLRPAALPSRLLKPSHLSHISRKTLPFASTPLALATKRFYTSPPPTPKSSSNPSSSSPSPSRDPKTRPPRNPSYGAASFSELGATKTVKRVVIFAICVVATVETFTYGMWAWGRWKSWREGRAAAGRGDGEGN